jgi:hypothetical protein
MKFKSDIEVQAGLKDSSGSSGSSGQILSSTNGNVSWVTPTVNTVARDVQNQVKAGVAINKGQAVYVTGADGTNIIVGLASNTTEATSSKTLGLLNATVSANGFADVVQIGRLAGLDTSAAIVGDAVWLGTNGNLIYGLTNKPYAPAHLVFIGVVTRVNASNGEIFITVQNGFELKEIHDVDLVTTVPVNGEVLGYNGTLWVNKTVAGWLGYTPVTNARTLTINGTTQDLSANRTFNIDTGVTSFNTRTGAVTLTSGDVTTALGYTPTNVTIGVNANGLTITGQQLQLALAGTSSNGALSSTDWNTFNSKQPALNGTGFIKASGATISYDNSTYTPTSRTITINGVTQDLSANQTWTVAGGVTSFNTRTGAITLTSGDVTTALGYTPVTNARTLTINGVSYDLSANRSWTVTGGLGGSGTATYLPKFTAATTVADSQLIDNGTYLSIGNPTNTRIKWGGTTTPTLGFPFSPTNALWLEVNDGDTGGIAIDNDGVTVYGAGDNGYVFRVIDEDVYQATTNVDASTTFYVTQGQNGGGYMRGILNVTDYLTAGNSARAPIFYDSGNTGYYCDPSYLSNLNQITANGELIIYTGTTSQFQIKSPTGTQSLWVRAGYTANGTGTPASAPTNIQFQSSGSFGGTFTFCTGNDVQLTINGSGITSANGVYGTIFYDSNNTGYYGDFASTSKLNTLQVGTLDSAISWSNNTYMLGSPTHGFRFNDSVSSINAFIIDNSGNTFAYASSRAPIFYDTNNTGYYVDPSNTSNINTAIVNGLLSVAGSTGNYNEGIRLMSGTGSWSNIQFGANTSGVGTQTNQWIVGKRPEGTFVMSLAGNQDGGSRFLIQQDGRVQAPVYYDGNNTNYYLDPGGTSNVNDTVQKILRFAGVGGDSGNGSNPDGYAIYQQGGPWNYPFPDLCIGYHTGIKIGAYYSYNGTRFYNNSDWATITASVNDGDNNFRGYYDVIAYASDKRLKHKVKPIEDALSKVKSLTGMTYQWNEIGKEHGWDPDTEVREAGVFAQDVQAVLPEAVRLAPFDDDHGISRSGESFLTVKYDKIVPLLIEAIKEQQTQIEELKELVNKLINK